MVDSCLKAKFCGPSVTVASLYHQSQERITIVQDGGELLLEENGRILSTFSLLPRPRFWNFQTRSGIPCRRLANFYGANCLNFNIYSGCQFYDVGKPCRFCSVKPTQNRHGQVEIRKLPQDLADTCHLAVEHDDVQWYLATGGSYLDSDVEFDRHMEVARAVRDVLPWNGRLRGNLSMMPPRDLGRLAQMHEIGVDHPSFNLEAWPETAFAFFCPGKSQYVGFDHILTAYDSLVSLYGPGKAWCNFVAGLTPLDDLLAGFTAMAERGVIPGANVFHPDVGSPLGMSIPSPNADYIVAAYNGAAKLYHRYGYKPFFDASVLRNSLANEAYEGLL